MSDESVWVFGISKHTGFIEATVVCDSSNAQRHARYFSRIGYKVRVVSEEEHEAFINADYDERIKQIRTMR